MMLTEAEARQQVCPHIRYCVNELGVIQDLDQPIYVHQNCKGSECGMAWRWGDWALKEPPTRFMDKPLLRPDFDFSKPARGYCGIAGKPEYSR